GTTYGRLDCLTMSGNFDLAPNGKRFVVVTLADSPSFPSRAFRDLRIRAVSVALELLPDFIHNCILTRSGHAGSTRFGISQRFLLRPAGITYVDCREGNGF